MVSHRDVTAPGHVVVCAADDRRRFERAAAASASLSELRERGRRAFRGFPRLVTDAFCFFYSPDAAVRDDGDHSVHRLQSLVVKYFFESPEFRSIRERTKLDFEAALAATEQFARRLLDYLETSRATNAHGGPVALGQVHIDGIVLADKVTAGDGSPLDKALLVIAKEIDGDADSLRILTDLCWQWGSESGFLQRLPYDERMELARRIRDTQKLQELARIVGRMRALALQKQRTRVAALPHEVYDVTVGSDWDALLPHELANLAHPLLRYDFYERLLDGRVAQYELRGEETYAKGSIIACVDTSGSMAGPNELIAKAIALALLDVARLQKRDCVVILFSSAGEWRSFAFFDDAATVRDPGGQVDAVSVVDAIVRVGSEFFGGGTDYESPLHEAIRVIKQEQETDADIVFITDDQCEVSPAFLEEFLSVKQAKQFSLYGVIVGAQAAEAKTLRALGDEVVSSTDLTDEVAGRIFEKV